jgi:hypothetical protein
MVKLSKSVPSSKYRVIARSFSGAFEANRTSYYSGCWIACGLKAGLSQGLFRKDGPFAGYRDMFGKEGSFAGGRCL